LINYIFVFIIVVIGFYYTKIFTPIKSEEKKMFSDFQDLYSDPIHEKLFPLYRNLETALDLFLGAPESCKHLYMEKVTTAHSALKGAQFMLEDSEEKDS
jgi:hypothetical protein